MICADAAARLMLLRAAIFAADAAAFISMLMLPRIADATRVLLLMR